MRLYAYWRILLIMVFGGVSAYPVWHVLFPDTLWFFKVWGALATGGEIGSLVGFVWQFANVERRSRSSGRLFAVSLFSGLAVCVPIVTVLLIPKLESEQVELNKIRALDVNRVVAVVIHVPGESDLEVTDHASLIHFVSGCRRSTLFYPSHERIKESGSISIILVEDETWKYGVAIPQRHQNDVVFSFESYLGPSYILVPGGIAPGATDERG